MAIVHHGSPTSGERVVGIHGQHLALAELGDGG